MTLHRQTFTAMGCPCEVLLECDDPDQAARALQTAIDEINRLDLKYSTWHPESSPGHWQSLRVACRSKPTPVDSETARLLDLAATAHRISDGRFDISAGPLVQLWNWRRGVVPTHECIEAARQRVGWNRVEWDSQTLHCPRPGMSLDLDGLVKEYAADAAISLLGQAGMTAALVNLGGDIACFSPPDATPWPIAVSHPDQPERPISRLSLVRGGFASSGTTQRCFEFDGHRYSHLINPLTGWPVQGWQAISVVADQCTLAGILATTALLMEADGARWLEAFGLPWLGIDSEQQLLGHLQTDSPDCHSPAAVTIRP